MCGTGVKTMIGFIYMWINKINGKKYICAHKGSYDDKYIGSGTYFKNAIKKYGIENFERIVLYEEKESVESLFRKEFEIINEMNAVFSSEYYNQTNFDPKYNHLYEDGRRLVFSEEHKKKLSIIAKNRSKEWKLRQSQRMKENNPYHRKEIVEKMKETKIRNGTLDQSGSNNPMYGRRWYNNGIETTVFIPGTEPIGWVVGKLKGISKRCSGENNPAKRPDVRQKISDSLKSSTKFKEYQERRKNANHKETDN